MTANSTSWVAESASSTIDPDVQARRASDGERSAGFHSDLTIDQEAAHELVTAEEFAAEFDDNPDDGTWYAKYRRLTAEQDALRRLAALVARGVEPLEGFLSPYVGVSAGGHAKVMRSRMASSSSKAASSMVIDSVSRIRSAFAGGSKEPSLPVKCWISPRAALA